VNGEFVPLSIYNIYEFEVRLYYLKYVTEIYLVSGNIFPK